MSDNANRYENRYEKRKRAMQQRHNPFSTDQPKSRATVSRKGISDTRKQPRLLSKSKHNYSFEAIFFGSLSVVSLILLAVALTSDLPDKLTPSALLTLSSSIALASLLIFTKE